MPCENVLLNHLDAPTRFLFFTLDEAAVCVGCFLTGVLTGHQLLGFIASIICAFLLRKLKGTEKNCSMKQIFYWFFPTNKRALKVNVPSYVRKFKG